MESLKGQKTRAKFLWDRGKLIGSKPSAKNLLRTKDV
jgi:hypothetical protein